MSLAWPHCSVVRLARGRNNSLRCFLRSVSGCDAAPHVSQGRSDGLEDGLVREFVRGEEKGRRASGRPDQSVSCRVCVARSGRVRRRLSIFRSALFVAAGAALAAAQLRRQDLQLPLQTSQGPPLRPQAQQRCGHVHRGFFRPRAPSLPRSSGRRSILVADLARERGEAALRAQHVRFRQLGAFSSHLL